MLKGRVNSSSKMVGIRVAAVTLSVALGLSLLVTGGTFAKWTDTISQMTGVTINIGDWGGEPPAISTEDDLPEGQAGKEFSQQFEASNSNNATWSVKNQLPAGLTMSSNGLLSGTPTASSTTVVTVIVKSSAGSDERDFRLTIIPAAPVFESQELPDGLEGTAYSVTLKATGESRVYDLIDGKLPTGLELSSHGVIYGTPVDSGPSNFTISVTNAGGSDSKAFTLNIESELPTISTSILPDAIRGSRYKQEIAGTGPFPTYAVANGSLPDGLTIDSTTGLITGLPTGHGLSKFTISKTNSKGSAFKDLSIDVRYEAPTLTTSDLPIARKGVEYSIPLLGAGGPSTHTISEGSLPNGLTLNSETGVISGSTTVIGDFNFTVNKSSESGVVTKSFVLESRLAAPVIDKIGMPNAYRNTYYEMQNTATGEEVIWSATGLPDGLSIDSSTGLISGTPSTISTINVFVTATNSGGESTVQLSLSVKGELPEIITESFPDGEVARAYSAKIEADGPKVTYRMSGSIPPGLTLEASTGILSGNPTKSGTFDVTFYATTSGGSVSQVFTIFIGVDKPTITTTKLDDAIQGIQYSLILDGQGEGSTYAITAGSLPAGISLSSSTGRLSGQATGHGSHTFTVTKTNSRDKAIQELTLNVVHQTPTLTGPSSLTQGRLDIAYNYSLPGVGNGSTYVITDGSLPEGVTINSETGDITGKPLVVGNFAFTVKKTNESGVASKEYTFEVTHVAPKITTQSFDRATVGVPYSMQIEATGLEVTYLQSYGVLPDGLTLNANTGVISGTPTTTGLSIVRIYAINSGGSSNYFQGYFYVDEVAPIMVSTSVPGGVVDEPYYAKIEVLGEGLEYTSTSLPQGISLDKSTGVISGTPKVTSTASITFTAKNSGGTVQLKAPIIIVTQAPTITTETLPEGIKGRSYNTTLAGVGTSNTFTISSGELPPGLRINNNGTISGTPTVRGDYAFTVAKTNVSGTTSKSFSVKISYVMPTILTEKLPNAIFDKSYSAPIYGAGDDVTYSISYGELPPGLSINSDGRITGSPTAFGEYEFTVLKSNLDGEASKQFSITVTHVAPTITTSSLPNALEGVYYEFALEGTGEESTYDLKSGSLPEGLNLNADTGVISGTTNVLGRSSQLTVAKTNSGGTVTKTLYITVTEAPPVITTTSYPDAIIGVPYFAQVQATGKSVTLKYLNGYGQTSMPSGLSFDPDTGVISGTPTRIESSSFTITATNTGGTASFRSSITVNAAPTDLNLSPLSSLTNALWLER